MKKERGMTGAALAASVFLALIFGMLLYRSMGFIYAIADDITSISIYFYNNTNNSKLVLSNIKLEATELTASPTADTTE